VYCEEDIQQVTVYQNGELSLWIGATCASSRIEFAWRATTYYALGHAGWPPYPPTPLATKPLEA
jgi:hypothetical protein